MQTFTPEQAEELYRNEAGQSDKHEESEPPALSVTNRLISHCHLCEETKQIFTWPTTNTETNCLCPTGSILGKRKSVQRLGMNAKMIKQQNHIHGVLYKVFPAYCTKLGCSEILQEKMCEQCGNLAYTTCRCTTFYTAPRCRFCDKLLCAVCFQWTRCQVCKDAATCFGCLNPCASHPVDHKSLYCPDHIKDGECIQCQFNKHVTEMKDGTERKAVLSYVQSQYYFLRDDYYEEKAKNKNCLCVSCDVERKWNLILIKEYKLGPFHLPLTLFSESLQEKKCPHCEGFFYMSKDCTNKEARTCTVCQLVICGFCKICNKSAS